MFKNLNLSRWIRSVFFFAPDEGAGGSGNAEADAKAKAEADDKAKQEELNKQFAERAQRAADAERKKLLEVLGVKDADEAAALLKIAREADEKTKTEAEKMTAKLQASEDARIKAETEAKEKTEAANKRLLDSEIKINASTALIEKDKIVRPAFKREALDDVLLLIDRTAITESEGAFKNVDKALEKLAKDKPWLLEDKQTTTRNGTPNEQRTRKQGDQGQPRTPIISSL